MIIPIKFLFSRLFFNLFFVIIVIFSITNTYFSALTGNYSANRYFVYINIFVIIIWELFYLLLYFINRSVINITKLELLLFIFSIAIFLIDRVNDVDLWYTLTHSFLILWWMFSYAFIRRILLSDARLFKSFYYWYLILVILFLCLTIIAQQKINIVKVSDNSVVGLSYYFIALIPIVISNSNKILKKLFFLSLLLIPLLSTKRGAIIAGIIMMIIYILSSDSKQKLLNLIKFIFIAIFICILIYLIDAFNNGVILSRFQTDELISGSGRADIYLSAFNILKERSITELLIGSGSGSTITLLGISGHNDFLEVFFSYGLFGVSIYILILFNFFGYLYRFDKTNNYRCAYLMCLALCSVLALLEGIIFNFVFFFIIIQFAFLHSSNSMR